MQNLSDRYQNQQNRFDMRINSLFAKYDQFGIKLVNDVQICMQQNPDRAQSLINAVNKLPPKPSILDLYFLLLNKNNMLPKLLNYKQEDFHELRSIWLNSVCGRIGADFATILRENHPKSQAAFAILETMTPVLIEMHLYKELRRVSSPLSKVLGLSSLLSLEESLCLYEKRPNTSNSPVIPNVLQSWLVMHCGTLGRHLRNEIQLLIQGKDARHLNSLYQAFKNIGELKDEQALYHILINDSHPLTVLLFHKKLTLSFWGINISSSSSIDRLHQQLSQLDKLYQLDHTALLEKVDDDEFESCGCW